MISITLVIGLIVLIFFVLCIMYNNTNQSINQSSNSNSNSNSDIDMENKIQMLELMNEAKHQVL